jgi:hypothetical protein
MQQPFSDKQGKTYLYEQRSGRRREVAVSQSDDYHHRLTSIDAFQWLPTRAITPKIGIFRLLFEPYYKTSSEARYDLNTNYQARFENRIGGNKT